MNIENMKMSPDTVTDRNIFIVIDNPGKNFTLAAFANRKLLYNYLAGLPGMKVLRTSNGIRELKSYLQLRNALAERGAVIIELLDKQPGTKLGSLEIIKAPLIRR